MKNKDFFRKPYMETPEDDYSDMMRYIPDAVQPDYRSKPHSEMIKPYDDRISDYGEMEHFSPNNFSIPEQPPSIDVTQPAVADPDPCEALRGFAFGSRTPYYKILCGESLSIDIQFEGGLPPYRLLGAAGSLRGSLSYGYSGDLFYHAPTICCGETTDHLLIGDACGKVANIIIIVEPLNYLTVTPAPIIIGSDAPSNGDCYSLSPAPAIETVFWTINKGSISNDGCVSGISGECGVATITATFDCQENEVMATKKVRMPNGVWIGISDVSCDSCASYWPSCQGFCDGVVIEGIYRYGYTEAWRQPPCSCPPSNTCSLGYCSPSALQVAIRTVTSEWQCA